MTKTGVILILIGPSGAGKDSLTNILVSRTDFYRYPSDTTRAMRPGESQGNPYTFHTQEEYERIRDAGGLFNDVSVGGFNYFLTMEVFELAARGHRCVLHLVYDEAIKVRERFPNTKLVLVLPPSEDEQRTRLAERGASDEEVERRMADEHVQHPPETGYDLVIVNRTGQLEQAAQQLLEFVGSA